MNQADSQSGVDSYINYCIEKKYDSIRGIIALLLFIITITFFWLLKPNVSIHNSPMYLPIITDLPAISKSEVRLVDHVNLDNYFLYKKVGHITITADYREDDESIYSKLIDQAQDIAAKAGANRLLVEGTRTSEWLDNVNKTFRLQALALQQ